MMSGNDGGTNEGDDVKRFSFKKRRLIMDDDDAGDDDDDEDGKRNMHGKRCKSILSRQTPQHHQHQLSPTFAQCGCAHRVSNGSYLQNT